MNSRQKLARGALVAASAAALVIGGVAAPAQAGAPIEMASFDFPDVGSFDDCGFQIDVNGGGHGRYLIKDARPLTDGQFFYLLQQTWYHATFTNHDTGKLATEDWHTTLFEQKAKVLSTYVAGDGSKHYIISWSVTESGPWDVWRDSTGMVALRVTGSHVVDYVADFVADDAPGGLTFLSQSDARASGKWDIPDFCALMTDLLG